jgi:hypothetical protein
MEVDVIKTQTTDFCQCSWLLVTSVRGMTPRDLYQDTHTPVRTAGITNVYSPLTEP